MMTKWIGAVSALLMAMIVGWVALAGAPCPTSAPKAPAQQPPAPSPPVRPPETAEPPLLPAPVLPGQPGAIMPVRSAPKPATSIMTTAAKEPARIELEPSGGQDAVVRLEWQKPVAPKVGQACDCALVVRNTSPDPIFDVVVRCRLSGPGDIVSTAPEAAIEDKVVSWSLGTLPSKQERQLIIRLATPTRGEIATQAAVTLTTASAMRFAVHEPKLVVTASAPERVMLGDVMTFALTVSNPGDGVAEQVKLHADLSDGLEHPRGKKIDFDVGNLAANESRTVQVVCTASAGGEQVCQASASSNSGLKADARAAAAVMASKLAIEVQGPKHRYIDRKAVYTIKVTNTGDIPADNIMLTDVVPAGIKILAASSGGRHDPAARQVTWFLGEIAPGESREATLEVQCSIAGDFVQKLSVQAARGLKVDAEAATRVEGISAVQLEVIDLNDPVAVGGETVYELRVTNTGTQTEAGVQLVCTIPTEKEQFVSASGPSAHNLVNGNEIVFQPLPKLAPRADAIYRITVKCTGPGIAKFQARMTSAILTEPVTKEEPTRIYED